ncbi:MAG: hypothetical protein ACJAYU_000112 [Bradymonadia bacterium]|jgi:hypothetical protein
MMKRTLLCLTLIAGLAACGDDEPNNAADTDTGTDAGVTDTGMEDTGTVDTGMEDTGTVDTGIEDTSTEDTSTEDTGTEDTGTEDTGVEDTGTEDTGVDTGVEPEPRGATGRPLLGDQIDRVGRPAISTALVGTFDGDADSSGAIKNSYNEAGMDAWASFAGEISGNLAILDALDATCGNQLLADDENADGRYAALAGILADDQLYVHSDRGECGTYLGLEAEIVGALDEGTGGCGGRTLDDDVIDRSYSVLAAGILTGVDDLITANDVPNLDTFPYLAGPQGE